MGKDTGGTWRYLRVSASGAISNDDAANFRVSSLGVSEDAGQFRVSAVGGTAGDNTFVDGEDQLVSANLVVSARSVSPTSANKGVVVAALSPDAQYFRVSATETSPVTTVSSHLLGGSIDNTSFEATQDDAGLLRVSAMGVDIADVSNSDAGDFRTSAIQGDAANLRISAINTLSANESVSAVLLGGTANVGSVNVEKAKGELSTNNSSTTPLGGDAVFTGTADEIKDYAAVNVSIWADQDSAADGLSLEWSQD
ncbi:MAG: hypothetical protein KAU20_07610, partial [Nanoarchaeota archaeon]|nr:hypothetical protein [Nanoarchaeota archaeon]